MLLDGNPRRNNLTKKCEIILYYYYEYLTLIGQLLHFAIIQGHLNLYWPLSLQSSHIQ